MRFLYAAILYPDVAQNTSMYTSLVMELTKQGHEVRVIAPTFDSDTAVHEEGGVQVLRVKSGPIFNTDVITKGLNTVLLNTRYTRALMKFWPDWKMDWILASTPPITLSPLIKKLKVLFEAKAYLILRDIFPQNAKDIGMFKGPFLFSYFRHRERHLYKTADIIGCMSPGNIAFLLRQDPDIFKKDKLTHYPNWIDPTDRAGQGAGLENFRQRFNLEGKFIALFGGNFGKPQKIEFVLALAHKVQHLEDVVFVLIGDGTEKERIRNLANHRNLKNVMIYDRIPLEEYQTLIGAADIGLVNLSDKFTIPNIPSRTLGYWEASLPVLAATDTYTDLNESLLKKYNAGLWSPTGNLEVYYAQFMKLYGDEDLRKTMGKNGRKAVEINFSVNRAVKLLIEQMDNFQELLC